MQRASLPAPGCMERGYCMEKNKGVTLIELIVVIGIMGVVAGLIGLSLVVVSRQRVSSAASDIKGQFQTAQTIALSKDDCYVKIEKNSSDEVVFTTYSSLEKKLDTCAIDKRIEVKIYAGSNEVNLSSGPVIMKYERQTGGFEYPTQNGSTLGKITRIVFGTGKREIVLRLNKATGKVTYD